MKASSIDYGGCGKFWIKLMSCRQILDGQSGSWKIASMKCCHKKDEEKNVSGGKCNSLWNGKLLQSKLDSDKLVLIQGLDNLFGNGNWHVLLICQTGPMKKKFREVCVQCSEQKEEFI